MYHYLGNERLQLWFFSPNVCAAFLVICVMLAIGLFLWVHEQGNTWCQIIAWTLFPVIPLLFIGIAATYSRGGYFACLACLSLGSILNRRRWSYAFTFLFIIIIFLTSGGISRAKAISDIAENSVKNRLLLWNGGTGIIAEHWFSGLESPPSAGEYYTAWIQPLWLDATYSTLISDYLTIAVSYGIPTLFVILSALLFCLHSGFFCWHQNKNPFLLYTLCAIIGYMVCSMFTTCYRFMNLIWILFFAILIVGTFVLSYCKIFHAHNFKWFLVPLISFIFCLSLFGYGKLINLRYPYSWNSRHIGQFLLLESRPKRNSSGTIIIIAKDALSSVRSHVRPLVQSGYSVTVLEMEPGKILLSEASLVINRLISETYTPVFIAAFSEEQSIQALALAEKSDSKKISGLILQNLPFTWPFEELSPDLLIRKTQLPILLLYDQPNENRSALFRALCKKNTISLEITTGSGSPTKTIDSWMKQKNSAGQSI